MIGFLNCIKVDKDELIKTKENRSLDSNNGRQQ
jgi:hypothetical protein